MLASEIIEKLKSLIAEHGDLVISFNDDWHDLVVDDISYVPEYTKEEMNGLFSVARFRILGSEDFNDYSKRVKGKLD